MAGWFPVVTLLVGYVTNSTSDWLTDRRILKREREAREATKRETRLERRTSFQRQTLLELQDALLELARTEAEMNLFDMRAYRETGEWHKGRFAPELDERNRMANARTAVLTSRVRDESIREMVKKFKDKTTAAMMSTNIDECRAAQFEGTPIFTGLTERIGEVLREIDEDANHE